MHELKTRVINVIDKINQSWVESLKTAEEKEQGVDLSEMMSKFSEHIKELDKYFLEAQERLKGSKKKGFFG